MDTYVEEVKAIERKAKEWKTLFDSHKKSILGTIRNVGPFQAGKRLFSEVTRSRTDIDKVKLGKFLAENGASLSEFENSSTYSFLDMKNVPLQMDKAQKKAA
jgi:hypothetical protein